MRARSAFDANPQRKIGQPRRRTLRRIRALRLERRRGPRFRRLSAARCWWKKLCMSHAQQQWRCFLLGRRLLSFHRWGLRAVFCCTYRCWCTGAPRVVRRGILTLMSLTVVLPLDGQSSCTLSPSWYNGLVVPSPLSSKGIFWRNNEDRDRGESCCCCWLYRKREWMGWRASQWPTKICDARGLGYLLFIRQTSNLNQNRVERWRNVPIGLLLLPLIAMVEKDRTNERKNKIEK